MGETYGVKGSFYIRPVTMVAGGVKKARLGVTKLKENSTYECDSEIRNVDLVLEIAGDKRSWSRAYKYVFWLDVLMLDVLRMDVCQCVR